MTDQGDAATRTIIIAQRFTVAEAREVRLLARAEGISTSEAIRRAVRQRADAIANGSRGNPGQLVTVE